jgi:hypothetical protein
MDLYGTTQRHRFAAEPSKETEVPHNSVYGNAKQDLRKLHHDRKLAHTLARQQAAETDKEIPRKECK